MKYLLIQHGDGGPATVSIHPTKEDRNRATLAAIFGEDDPANLQHEDEMRKTLEVLEEDGRITFEGDPPVEWLNAFVENKQICQHE